MKVSVVTTAYNHEEFIAQAIESVLMQKTNFDFELLISDDCSTDGTRGIIINYKNIFPDRIRLFLRETNIGGKSNLVEMLKFCQGEYVALLEGDDYWTSEDKLQKQVDYLDQHPECSLCFHNAQFIYVDENRNPRNFCSPDQKEITTTEDLLEMNYINTATVMFRNGLIKEFPEWYHKVPFGDYPLFILLSEHGKIGYIDEVMSAYRIHARGVWSGRSTEKRIKDLFDVYDQVNAHFHYRYDDIIRRGKIHYIDYLEDSLVQQTTMNKSLKDGRAEIKNIFDNWPEGLPITKDWKHRILGRFYAYFLFLSHQTQDFSGMRSSFINLLYYDSSWFADRGVWSVGIEAFLGHKISTKLRQGVRWLRARTA